MLPWPKPAFQSMDVASRMFLRCHSFAKRAMPSHWHAARACSGTSQVVEFEYAGRRVTLAHGPWGGLARPAYEPRLVTSPEDARIKHIMAVVERYQRLTSGNQVALTLADWSGSWTLGVRNVGWTRFLGALGVPQEMFETAATYDDMHWYSVNEESLTMRHCIPVQKMDLRYCAKLDWTWRLSPYNKQTSSTWSVDESAKHGFKWRNRWVTFPVSTRTEWENKGGKHAGHGQVASQTGTEDVTGITVMERHLISPELINFIVWVYPVGGDPEDDGRFIVPRTGVTYVRAGDDLPEGMPDMYSSF